MKKGLLFIGLIIVVSSSIFGQTSFLGGRYEINIPVGSYEEDFMQSTSFVGFGIDYNYLFDDNFAVGFSFSWGRFYEEQDRETYTFPNGAITAKVWDYNYNWNMYLTGSYFFTTQSMVKPYFKVGAGTNYSEIIKLVGVFNAFGYRWGFSVKPEFGFLIHFSEADFGLSLSTHYNYSTLDTELVENIQYLGFAFGMYYCPQWKF